MVQQKTVCYFSSAGDAPYGWDLSCVAILGNIRASAGGIQNYGAIFYVNDRSHDLTKKLEK